MAWLPIICNNGAESSSSLPANISTTCLRLRKSFYGARIHSSKKWAAGEAQLEYPVRFAVECVRQMFRQFFTFTAGSGNYPIRSGPEFEGFRELYPGDVSQYLLSRQSIGKLAMDAYRVTPVYAAVFWCSFGVSLMALLTRRFRVRRADQLFVLTLIFLFANALTTGALSGINDRYQARASWLMGLCCAAYVIPYLLHWRDRRRVIDLSRNPT